MPPSSLREVTVLLIEDDPAARDCYREALIASRYDVITAADGYTALQLIDQLKPDVVVLDVELPRESGWDLYRVARRRWSMPRLPIILLTEEPGGDDVPPVVLAACLQKPVDPTALVAEVVRALQQTR